MDHGKGMNSFQPSITSCAICGNDPGDYDMFLFLSVSPRSWAVCFTYGVWFGLEAFACMGHTFQEK